MSLTRDCLRAGLIYGGGDLVATWLTGRVDPVRSASILVIGALLYAPEIRFWFGWLERRFPDPATPRARWLRAFFSWLWFNPVWIARHALFIRLAGGGPAEAGPELLVIGLKAFLLNMPVALTANYLIQNRVSPRRRLLASASFSALMAVYYALSEVWFG